MVKYKGINHLAMATPDMHATIRFYRDLLGMRLVAGMGKPGYRHYFFEISEYDMIAFFEWKEVKKIPEKDHGVPVSGPFAFDHISFEVESDDGLWEIKDRIEAYGEWVSEVIDHGFIHSIYTFDPNHIPIEFSAPVHAVDLRKTPKMKDKVPTEAAKEGPDPVLGNRPIVTQPTPENERITYPGDGRVFLEDSNE